MIGSPALVVMGVAGAGKSQLARAVSARTGATFIEGDDLHPPANVAKMAAGTALDDADREEWLERIGRQLQRAGADGRFAVATCSALKRRYRDRLRAAVPTVAFVYLRIDATEAAARVAARPGHFMPAQLVASQFAALEPPTDEPAVLELDATARPATLLADVLAWWPQDAGADERGTPPRR